MKQKENRWAIAIVASMVFVTIYVLIFIVASSSVTYRAVLADSDLTPTVWIYLPYISRKEPSTPTPTPIPTNTPIPTQTPISSSVEILPNQFTYETRPGNGTILVGEVRNNTDKYVDVARWITVKVFDSEGRHIDTGFSDLDHDHIPPGHKTCFRLVFFTPPSDWSYYEFEPLDYSMTETLPDMTIVSDNSSYNPDDGFYYVMGQLRNDHAGFITSPQVIATLYNFSGAPVGCEHASADEVTIYPGQVSNFNILFSQRDYSDVVSYTIQPEAGHW